jgi:hypothetical protein
VLVNAIRNAIGKFWIELLVLALYLVLTLILLYPFSVLKMGTQLIGDGGDGWQNLWNLWWVRQSVLSLKNPYWTNNIYYPYGADLMVHTLSPLAGILTIPIQLTLGLVFSYNLLIILSFVLGGFGAYLLAYHITKSRVASFFAGLVFAFSSYHFAWSFGHLNMASIEWTPFYVLFLLKIRHEKSLKNVFYAAIFLTLASLMGDLQYTLFLGLFTIFFIAYELISNRDQIVKFLIRLGTMTVVFLGVTSLVLVPLLHGWLTGQYTYVTRSYYEFTFYSADLLGFFVPSHFNSLFGKYTIGIVSNFSSARALTYPSIEGVVYIGYTILILAGYAVMRLRKAARFWIISSVIFVILSLGPMLQVMGSTEFTIFHVSVPLPGLILYYVTPILRVPARMIVMAMLCLAVLSAISLKHLVARIASLKNGRVASLLFIVLISGVLLAEHNILPYPVVQDTSIPPFYYELAKKNGTFAVLDLPIYYAAINRYMYYSTASGKPLVEGQISRPSLMNIQLLRSIPIIGQTDSILKDNDPMTQTSVIMQDLNITNLNAFNFFDIRYIVVHKYYMTDAALTKLVAYLNSLVGLPAYSDEKIIAYEANVPKLQGIFTFLLDGWWDIEHWNGVPGVWMTNNGAIAVISSSPEVIRLSFCATTSYITTTLRVFLNNELIGVFQISPTSSSHILISGLSLREGTNRISLNSEHSFIPAEITKSPDMRCLSIAVQNVEISLE